MGGRCGNPHNVAVMYICNQRIPTTQDRHLSISAAHLHGFLNWTHPQKKGTRRSKRMNSQSLQVLDLNQTVEVTHNLWFAHT